MTRPRVALFTAGPLYGHMRPLLLQADELARRGWRVVFAVLDEGRQHVARQPGICFASLGSSGLDPETVDRLRTRITMERSFTRSMLIVLAALGQSWGKAYDSLRQVLDHEQPDIVVADLASTPAISAAESAGIPCVVNNPDLLAVLPAGLLPPAPSVPLLLSGRSVFSIGAADRRLYPARRALAVLTANIVVGRPLNAARRSRGLPRVNFHTWLADKPILVNSAFGLEYRRPLPTTIHMVGPMLPRAAEPLPREYAEWLDSGPPVAYVNLGTVARPWPDLALRITEGLRSSQFRALWVVPSDQQSLLPNELPSAVRVESWVPSQVSLLRHPNVLAFLSHCGVNSVHESLCASTPVVGIPLFAAQGDMAWRVQDAGVGVWLDKYRFTPQQLRDAITQTGTSDALRANIPAIQATFAAAGGVRRAADLIEQTAAA
jgi:UDP:flavonoid glycosyltransferase YjiC (YdhE family)